MDNSLVELGSSEFSKKINEDKNGILLDIRTPQEYKKGHIPNSLLMNIYEPTFAEDIQKLDKEKNYYLYCRSGNRSYHAAHLMIKFGFKNVFNLTSGILSWKEPLEH